MIRYADNRNKPTRNAINTHLAFRRCVKRRTVVRIFLYYMFDQVPKANQRDCAMEDLIGCVTMLVSTRAWFQHERATERINGKGAQALSPPNGRR
jgi:hypothetical protein